MATERTVKLNVDATQAQKSLDKFGGTLEDLYGEGVQPLNFAIGELEDRLYEMAAAGQSGTKEFQDMAEEVGRMKKVIIDTDLLVDGMSQNLAQNLAGATAGLASGFELAQGAMGAFGVQGEKVEEALLKVQSAMAISQGLQGLKESIASFQALGAMIKKTAVVQKLLTSSTWLGQAAQWALNVAMNANPIGALILAITALVGAITYFASAANDAAEVNERLNKSIEEGERLMERTEKSIRKNMEQRMELLEATGASEEDLHKERLLNLKKEEEIRKINAKKEKLIIEDKRKAYERALKQGNEDLAREIKEEIAQRKAAYNELIDANGDYHHNLTIENENFRREEEERRKANYEKWQAQVEEAAANRLEALRKAQDLELSLITDQTQKSREELRIRYERELEDLEANEKYTAEEKARLRALYEQKANQDLADLQLNYANELSLKTVEIKKQEAELIAKVRIQSEEETNEKLKEYQREYRAEVIQTAEQRIGLAQDMFSAIGELANAFADDSEAAQRRAFNINKAVGIANAIINTSVGITKALATLPPPVSFITAATTAVSGAAQIATIAKSQFEGGGGSGVSTSGLSAGASIASRPAEFNVVGNTGTNQLAQSLGEKPLKAYVVPGEVTTAQSLDRNKIETASL